MVKKKVEIRPLGKACPKAAFQYQTAVFCGNIGAFGQSLPRFAAVKAVFTLKSLGQQKSLDRLIAAKAGKKKCGKHYTIAAILIMGKLESFFNLSSPRKQFFQKFAAECNFFCEISRIYRETVNMALFCNLLCVIIM